MENFGEKTGGEKTQWIGGGGRRGLLRRPCYFTMFREHGGTKYDCSNGHSRTKGPGE